MKVVDFRQAGGYLPSMDKSERKALKDTGGRMRPTEPHAKPLPWASLDHVHEAEAQGEFVWDEEREEAFLLLLAKGYSIGRITSQNLPGWPTYADYLKKVGTDAEFKQKCKSTNFFRAESIVDVAEMVSESATAATAIRDRLRVDVAFRRAAILDPETYGNKAQLGVSGGLILAAGSLADLAAQAAQLHTNPQSRVTQSAPDVLPAPNNVSRAKVDDTLQHVSEPDDVA